MALKPIRIYDVNSTQIYLCLSRLTTAVDHHISHECGPLTFDSKVSNYMQYLEQYISIVFHLKLFC